MNFLKKLKKRTSAKFDKRQAWPSSSTQTAKTSAPTQATTHDEVVVPVVPVPAPVEPLAQTLPFSPAEQQVEQVVATTTIIPENTNKLIGMALSSTETPTTTMTPAMSAGTTICDSDEMLASSSTLTFKPLHPTFGAEVQGSDFSAPLDDQLLVEQIKKAVAKYGVCVFRGTQLDDERQVRLARRLGEVEPEDLPTGCDFLGNNNSNSTIFHADGSSNARRTRFTMLRAVESPPLGAGGNIEFVDTRTAFAELPETWHDELLARDYVASHAHAHAHDSPRDDDDHHHQPPSRHRLVQWHLPSDRLALYLPSPAHAHNNDNHHLIDGLPAAEAAAKLAFLRAHATDEKYVLGVPWRGAGDLLLWDNTCTLHRAAGEEPTAPRLRRCAIFDDGVDAYGLNPRDKRLSFAYSK